MVTCFNPGLGSMAPTHLSTYLHSLGKDISTEGVPYFAPYEQMFNVIFLMLQNIHPFQ